VAYEVNGSVYFDVRKFAEYGKLSRRTFDEMESGTRVEANPEKRFPADFALWKKAEAGHIMQWPSPWGDGFPGWHLECSAMSMKYLGQSFDIHGGGLENQFPHHECEIAQSEAVTGQPFVRYWLHNNMVTRDGRKMGKSLGNSLTLKDAFALWSPQVIRFFILQSHYRSTLDFSDTAVGGASRGLEKLVNTVRNLRGLRTSVREGNAESGVDLKKYESAFIEAMNDDFNTPQAIAALFDCSRDVNQAIADGRLTSRATVEQIYAFFTVHATQVLGITFDEGDRATGSSSAEPDLLKLFIALRADLRKEKLWSLSDKIRDGLAALGYVLEDKKDGTSWKKVETPTAQ
jgi:cysteinyl-tRNA synthetase